MHKDVRLYSVQDQQQGYHSVRRFVQPDRYCIFSVELLMEWLPKGSSKVGIGTEDVSIYRSLTAEDERSIQ